MRKVLLFGTSGNPPTGRDGHSGMVEYLVNLGTFDEIWVLPVYQHMFAGKRVAMGEAGAPTYEDRLEMCRLAFERHSSLTCRVKVLRTEQEVFTEMLKAQEGRDTTKPTRSSTYDVVTYLKKRHSDAQFSFLMGTDTYQDLRKGKWFRSEELMAMVSLVVVDRVGVRAETEKALIGVEMHHLPMLTDVSSTKIRSATARELAGAIMSVDPYVLDYMRERRLYGFGRQWWFTRIAMRASERFSTSNRWLLVAGAAGLLVVVGIGAAVSASSERRRGCHVHLMR